MMGDGEYMSAMLSLDGTDGIRFSIGSLLVLAATICWGLKKTVPGRFHRKALMRLSCSKVSFPEAALLRLHSFWEKGYRVSNGSLPL